MGIRTDSLAEYESAEDPAGGGTFLWPNKKVPKEIGLGERWERCQWQVKRPERVAAVSG